MTNLMKAIEKLDRICKVSRHPGGGLLEDWHNELGAILNLLRSEQAPPATELSRELRNRAGQCRSFGPSRNADLMDRAADALDRQAQEIAELRERLKEKGAAND